MIKDKLEFDSNFNIIKRQRYINNELIEEYNYNSFGSQIGYQFKKNSYEYTLNEDNKMNGLCYYYWNNGNLCEECNFKNGERHGLYRSYFSNGDLFEECNYKNGELIK